MPQREIISGFIDQVAVGTTNESDPILFMQVNGVNVGGTYMIQDLGDSKRYIFPKKTGNTIYIVHMGQVYGQALPEVDLTDLKIFVAK